MALFIAILIFGEVSGGHFNPATTLGVLIREHKFSNIPFAFYIILSQVFGAFLGNAFQFLTILMKVTQADKEVTTGIVKANIDPKKDGINILCPFYDDNDANVSAYLTSDENKGQCDPGDNWKRVLFVEMMCTFTLVTFIKK